MSFAERLAGLMARPGQDNVPRDDVPWHLKYGGRAVGIVGGFFAVLFGLYNCLGILLGSISCLVGGILEILAGFVVLAIEAPCCFMFVDFVQQVAEKADERPYWYRAAFYCVIAIPPVILCFGLGSLFGCGLIFCTGMIYGMMALGKKASFAEMRAAAAAATAASSTEQGRSGGSGLAPSQGGSAPNSKQSTTLVNNVQPIAYSMPPPYDSVA
ncbi:calcium channel flower isoform X1 [Toxorhynchites rutilus septentrionalis]|uniref:calcium channel flower isoform X1 n=1 Tax=Toxorhynchites rutilus septentrionalis TaxID=329112 RepID=UPI0024791BBC|nr:calcium channel flower isoform X1 [Toxorhynchites rutilus septentrionalis]